MRIDTVYSKTLSYVRVYIVSILKIDMYSKYVHKNF